MNALSSHFTTWQHAWQATAPQLAGGLNKCPRGEQPCWLFLCLPFQHLIIEPQKKKNLTRKPRTPFLSHWPGLLLAFLSSFIFWRLSKSPVWRSFVHQNRGVFLSSMARGRLHALCPQCACLGLAVSQGFFIFFSIVSS